MAGNNEERLPVWSGHVGRVSLLLHYAKLIFWLVSFVVIIIFVYLYTRDMRARINKSWDIANELQTKNDALDRNNALLKRQIIDFDIRIMQKNAQIHQLEHTVEELRKGKQSS